MILTYCLLGYFYFMWSFSWSLVAASRQKQIYKKRVFICWVLNFIFAPIAIIIAMTCKAKMPPNIRVRIILSPIVMPIVILLTLLPHAFFRLSDLFLYLGDKLTFFKDFFDEFLDKVVKFITSY